VSVGKLIELLRIGHDVPRLLIAFRALQGLGAALLTPAALSLVVTTFTDQRQRHLALGVWGAAVGSGGATGLLLGGALTELDWRWIFFINIPIGIAVLAVAPLVLRESRSEQAARTFDVAGAISSTAGLGLLVYGLMFLLGTLYMQRVLGYSPVETGLSFLAVTLTILLLAAPVQSMVGRVGIRPLMVGGFLVVAAGLAWLTRMPVDGQYVTDLLPGFLALGIGSTLVFVPGQIGAQGGVAPEDSGVASGLINTSQQIGGAVGVAIATTIATTATGTYVEENPGTDTLSAAAITHGFEVAIWVFAGVAAVAAVLTALVIERKKDQPDVAPGPEPVLVA
jgi:hypothetical protein